MRCRGGRSTTMIAGRTREVANLKRRDRVDFCLWKPSENGQRRGGNSLGIAGRPGWHIEMFGYGRTNCLWKNHLAIQDASVEGAKKPASTVFAFRRRAWTAIPHHEGRMPKAAAPTARRNARYWLHNEMLSVEGSKCPGRFVLFTEGLVGTGRAGRMCRFVMAHAHLSASRWLDGESADEAEKFVRKCAMVLKSGLRVRLPEGAQKREPLNQVLNSWTILKML